MKITIDNSDNKLYIHQFTNIGELVRELQEIFPDDRWKKYDIVYETPPIVYTGYYDVDTNTPTVQYNGIINGSGFTTSTYTSTHPRLGKRKV